MSLLKHFDVLMFPYEKGADFFWYFNNEQRSPNLIHIGEANSCSAETTIDRRRKRMIGKESSKQEGKGGRRAAAAAAARDRVRSNEGESENSVPLRAFPNWMLGVKEESYLQETYGRLGPQATKSCNLLPVRAVPQNKKLSGKKSPKTEKTGGRIVICNALKSLRK